MSAENLKPELDDAVVELSEAELEEIVGGAGGKTRKLVCDTCGYTVDANVGGVQTMTKHCASQHNNKGYHVA